MTDEPIFIADLLAKRNLRQIGVLMEQSLIGQSYLANLRTACRRGESGSPPVRRRPDRPGHQRRGARAARGEVRGDRAPGFGFGIVFINPAGGPRLGPAAVPPPRLSRTPGST